MTEQSYETVKHQRDVLAQAIQDAAEKAGLVEPNQELSGPQIMMLVSDMGDALAEVRTQRFGMYRTLARVRDKLTKPDIHISNDVPGAKRLIRELMSQLAHDREAHDGNVQGSSAET